MRWGALAASVAVLFGAHAAIDHARPGGKPPRSVSRPVISGEPASGVLLRATAGRWTGTPSRIRFQWQRCSGAGHPCRSIRAAGGQTYLVAASDFGHRLRVRVRATNTAGSALALSAATRIVGRRAGPGPTAPSTGTPLPVPAPVLTCSAKFSSLPAAVAALGRAGGRTTACLTSGHYGAVALGMRKSADAILAAAPGAHVVVGAVHLSGSHIGLEGTWIDGEVDINAGSSFITLDHNDITGGYFGIVFDTSDCRAPNAPTWSGCQPNPKITDVTIAGNHFHDIGQTSGEDAIHLDNWARVRVSGNEFDHIIESGNHTDCLQSVYGGTDLVFDHNYEHDNNCQGFFVKDGDAVNVSFVDNLFVRDAIGSYANYAQIWNTAGLIVEHNTIWDEKGLALVTDGATVPPTGQVDHNLLAEASLNDSGGPRYALREGTNIFGDPGVRFPRNSSDRVSAHPRFENRGADDYRLVHNRRGIGIDWRPSDTTYGPSS